MGLPLPPTDPIGDPCGAACPNLWTPGSTPQFIQATLEEIIKCAGAWPDAPNDSFVLEQLDGFPCWWQYMDDDYVIDYIMTVDGTDLTARTNATPTRFYFRGHDDAICTLEFDNSITACSNSTWAGHSGTAVADFSGEFETEMVPLAYEPYLIANVYNFLSVPGTRSDPAEITSARHCYKFVNHEFNTRILISFDKDHEYT